MASTPSTQRLVGFGRLEADEHTVEESFESLRALIGASSTSTRLSANAASVSDELISASIAASSVATVCGNSDRSDIAVASNNRALRISSSPS